MATYHILSNAPGNNKKTEVTAEGLVVVADANTGNFKIQDGADIIYFIGNTEHVMAVLITQ